VTTFQLELEDPEPEEEETYEGEPEAPEDS